MTSLYKEKIKNRLKLNIIDIFQLVMDKSGSLKQFKHCHLKTIKITVFEVFSDWLKQRVNKWGYR